MKRSTLFAATIGIVNTITLSLCQQIDDDSWRQTIVTIAQALSPFISLVVMRLYVKFDHPPELIRQESAIDAAIKVCRKQLKDETSCSREFLSTTQRQLEGLLLQKQKLRLEFERSTTYQPTLPPSSDPDESGA